MNTSKKSQSLNRKIDLRLQRIASVLLLNASFINNPGLLNGKMGITIFFYEYARYTGNKVFEDYAGELIDQIYEEINTSTPVDFENGLTGIGWGIEFLVKNGFVETNTNEVLADVDEAVYKSLLAGINFNDLEGFLLYIMSRIENESMKGHQKENLKRNSLVLLLNEYAKFVALDNGKEQIVSDKTTVIRTIRNLIEEINKVGLCPDKIADIREILTPLNKMEDKEFKSEDKSVTEHATDEIWQIISSPDIQKLGPETSTLFHALFNYIDSEENWKTTLDGINNDNTGINKGLAGIGFALLHIAMSQRLAGGKISNLDSPLTNHSDRLSLFIFKSSSRGMQYGMGTYINELTGALLNHTDISIFLVCYNSSENKEFSIETISERYLKIIIPAPIRSPGQTTKSEERYGSVVARFLSRVIPETGDIVFQMNYLDDLPIIMNLKEKYRNPVISMVHFAQWQQLFNGNKQKLKGLNIEKPTNNIEFTLSREKQMYEISDHIVSVTRYMKDFLIYEYGIRPDKIDVVPNGLNLKGVKPVTAEEKQKIKKALGFGSHEK